MGLNDFDIMENIMKCNLWAFEATGSQNFGLYNLLEFILGYSCEIFAIAWISHRYEATSYEISAYVLKKDLPNPIRARFCGLYINDPVICIIQIRSQIHLRHRVIHPSYESQLSFPVGIIH